MKNLLIVFALLLCFFICNLILFLLLFCGFIKAFEFPHFCFKPIQFRLSLCPFFLLCYCFLQIQLRIFQQGTLLFQLFHIFMKLLFLADICFLSGSAFFQLHPDFIQFLLKLFQNLIFFQLLLFFTDQNPQCFAFLVCIFIFFRLPESLLKIRKKLLKLLPGKIFFLFKVPLLRREMQYIFHCANLLIHLLFLFQKLAFPFFSLINKALQNLKAPLQLTFEFPLFQFCKFLCFCPFSLPELHPVQILCNASAHFIVLLISGLCRLLKLQLYLLINPCMKDLPEYLPSLHCSCKKQLLEISLCDHGDLGKLLVVKSKQFFDGSCHISRLCHGLTLIWINKLCLCFPESQSCAPFLWCHIFRTSKDLIFFSLIRKNKLHKSLRGSVCILASEHGRVSYLAACLAVKCKSDCIKYGSFSSSRISGDEIKATVPKPGKINLCSVCIRPEGADGQFFRSQMLTSCIFRIRSSENFRCSSFIGWLFCSSKNS